MKNPMSDQGESFSLQPLNAIESISRAEIDQQISTAKRYPRKLVEVRSSMMELATIDEETAASCFYSVPRGGKNIQGPSIRLAEIAFSSYQNIRAGTRIIEAVVDGPSPYVAIQAVCHDLEKNIAVMIEKRRRIVGKKSKGGIIDEDDINLAANAGSAIAFRDAMFKVVPGILLRPIYEAAKKVAIGDAKTLNDRRQKAIEHFQKMGVSADRVLASIGRTKVDEVTLEDLETLIGTFTAIKEGSLSIEDAFPPVPAKESSKKVEKPDFGGEEKQKSQAGPSQNAPDSEPGASPEPPRDEKKAKTAAKSKEPTSKPQEQQVSLQDQVLKLLIEQQYNEAEFIAGLLLIKFPGLADDTELVHELTDDSCALILDKGLSHWLEQIRDARWLESTK